MKEQYEVGYQAGLAQQFSDRDIFQHGWNAALQHASEHFDKALEAKFKEGHDQGYSEGVDAGMKIK